jgi:hypothetical protein
MPARFRRPRRTIAALMALSLVLPALCAVTAHADTRPGGQSQKPTYKWVDEQGVVHYGDAVPPQYADQEKTVLNGQGMAIGTIEGKKTAEQLATAAARRASDEKSESARLRAQDRDRQLLATYLTVEEIESLRDRRVELLDAQALVTSQYLEQLRSQQRQLETQAERFRPYNAQAALPLPDRLAEDLVRGIEVIHTQERNLDTKRREAADLKANFAADIARFKELKHVGADSARPRAN